MVSVQDGGESLKTLPLQRVQALPPRWTGTLTKTEQFSQAEYELESTTDKHAYDKQLIV